MRLIGSKLFQNERGLGLLGTLLAALGVTILALVTSIYINRSGQRSLQLSQATVCQAAASNIISSITSINNVLQVRNYLAYPGHVRPGSDANDPICNGTKNIGCDTIDHETDFAKTINLGSKVPGLYSGQNVRGGMAWALGVFNTRKPAICTMPVGETFVLRSVGGGSLNSSVLAQLNSILPSDYNPDRQVEKVSLLIQREDGNNSNCSSGTLKLASRDLVPLRITVNVTYRKDTGVSESCGQSVTVSYPEDQTNAPISQAWVRTRTVDGTDLSTAPDAVGLPGVKCTCQKGAGNCTSTDIYGAQMQVAASEVGSNFICNRFTDGVPMPAMLNYMYCTNLGATINMTSPTYNVPTAATMSLSFPQGAGEHTYQYFVRSVDSAGNISPNEVSSLRVVTRTPVCQPSSYYACGVSYTDDCGAICGVGTNCACTPTLTCQLPTAFCGAPTAPATDGCNACPVGTNCPTPCTFSLVFGLSAALMPSLDFTAFTGDFLLTNVDCVSTAVGRAMGGPFGPSVTFTCADIGVRTVFVRGTSSTGVNTVLSTTITISDPNGFCP